MNNYVYLCLQCEKYSKATVELISHFYILVSSPYQFVYSVLC